MTGAIHKSFRLLSLSALAAMTLGLSACGEGWEIKTYTGAPYGDGRTAGTGVAYVRVKLLPEKREKLEKLEKPEPPAVADAPKPIEPITTEAPVGEPKVLSLQPVLEKALSK